MSKHAKQFGAVMLTSAALFAAGGTAASAAGAAAASPDTLSGIQAAASAAITLRVNDLNAAIAKVQCGKEPRRRRRPRWPPTSTSTSPRSRRWGRRSPRTRRYRRPKPTTAPSSPTTGCWPWCCLHARLAATSDAIDNGDVPNLTTATADAAKHVNTANQATLQPLIDSLNNEISAASNATSGVASTVLGYAPSQWNANNQLLAPARSSVTSATGDIRQARSDVRQIRAALKAARPATTTPPTT